MTVAVRDIDALHQRRFAGVLFDLDGTLVDSTAAVRRAWDAWAAAEGVDPAELARWSGTPAREIVAAFVPAGRAADSVRRYTELAQRTVEGVVPLPGAREALARTEPHCAVVTSSSGPVTRARSRAAALALPARLVTADDVTRGKPDPESYLRGAELLGLSPADCLAVEDTPTGVRSAEAAGCPVVGLAYGQPEISADWVVHDLSELWFNASDGGVRVRARGSAAAGASGTPVVADRA